MLRFYTTSKGWVVPMWYSDTPLTSKRFSSLTKQQVINILKEIRKPKK